MLVMMMMMIIIIIIIIIKNYKIFINTFQASCYLQVKILILKIQLTKIVKIFLSLSTCETILHPPVRSSVRS